MAVERGSRVKVFLSAGEASGEMYGAAILRGIRLGLAARGVESHFFGLGGPQMEAAGLGRIVRAEDVAHMGITEVIRHAPRVWRGYRLLVDAIRAEGPDVAVLIDFPDVNFRLAKHLKRLGVPVVWFVSPQLWAWKRRRLHWVKERVDRMLVIFPFEEAFYRNRGVQAEFVGHPLAQLPDPAVPRDIYAAHHGLEARKPWIALLPGSRWREIEANLPAMVEMACRFPRPVEYILPVASTIDRQRLAEFVQGWIAHAPGTDPGVPQPYIHLVEEAREALRHARASVVASGTATVQAALIGNPFVVVYRVSALTFRIAKNLVWYPPEIPAEVDREGNLPIAMVNLVAGRRVVPELLQDQFNAEELNRQLEPLLRDGPKRERMMLDLLEVRARLEGPVGDVGAIERVVGVVTGLVEQRLQAAG